MIGRNPKNEKWKLAAWVALILLSLFFFAAIADVGAGENGGGCYTWHDGDKDYYPQVRYLVSASDSDNRAGSDIVEASCSLAGDWIRKADTPAAGGYGEAVVGIGDHIYIARCMYASSTPYFWRYDPSTDNWNHSTNVSSLPIGAFRNGAALAWDHGDYIYALLGARYTVEDDERCLFYRYGIITEIWVQLADTPHAQGAGDAIAWSGYDNRIYAVIGNKDRKSIFTCYNISNNSWDELPFNPNWTSTDDGASLVGTGSEYLYALRGEYDETVPNGDFARYYIPNGTWEDMSPISESDGVGDGASLLWTEKYPDYIYALGGGSCLEDPGCNFYHYNITSNKWKPLESIPCPVGYYVGNRLGFANGHIYYWQGTPSSEKWICGGKAFLMFDIDIPPEITSYAPKSPVNDTECATRTFNITMFHSNSSLWDCFARGYSGFT
uniref:N-acetylneuraminate epimerase n=1 Tax=Candidatus Methanophaga sp. ANME-1 ERB7 TaxID=2759913 RepID=A0A7G9ZCI3_9EURY|nr:hypothetical protein NNIPPFBB_00012 [Methanosarcinales archaeon ANME-1 ERB7]